MESREAAEKGAYLTAVSKEFGDSFATSAIKVAKRFGARRMNRAFAGSMAVV